jgi:predicted nucleic acid-binding protein
VRDRLAQLVDRLTDAAYRRSAVSERSDGWPASSELDQVLAVLKADYAAPNPAADSSKPSARGRQAKERTASATDDRLGQLAPVFGLDDIDCLLLTIAVAPELDANLGLAYGLLRGAGAGGAAISATASRATVGLALELAGLPSLTAAGFDRLGPGSALLDNRLLEVVGNEPWLTRALRVPDSVAAFVAGSDQGDPVVAAMSIVGLPLALAESDALSRGLANGARLVWVTSLAGTAGLSLATGSLAALGISVLAVDARRCPPDVDMVSALASAARQAGMRGNALVVIGAEVLGEPANRGALAVLERAAVPVIAVGSRPWNPAWLHHFPLVVEAQPLTVADREQVWQSSLGELTAADEQLRQALLGLRLTPEDIAETVRYAHLLAAAQGSVVSAATVREAARRVGGSGGAGSERVSVTSRVGHGPTFNDLVLPEHAMGSLHQLLNWARHRDEVTARGALSGKGNGIAALFTGSPGTGKTLAAHVIAEELAIDLFQVDLSAVVDKYIGETEKNLERVFQAAEALDVVLFFDEADALFGSRSEVRDARDRYANQEVAYLLQRMESFSGITILATNLRGNLDQAFSRRMSFIVQFPDPDVPTRRRLWERHLGQLGSMDPADPVELDFLSESVELAGGDIRNIVLATAYDAVSSGERPGMRHVTEAVIREYRKLGRRVPEHGFTPPK